MSAISLRSRVIAVMLATLIGLAVAAAPTPLTTSGDAVAQTHA